MKSSFTRTALALVLAAPVMTVASGCGGDDGGTPPDAPVPESQLPPQGQAALASWIAAGFYLGWTCEPDPHPAREPSPHGMNRICNNAALADATGSAPFPIGAASVKEIYDDTTALVGYAVYRKLADGTDGVNWYWYEVIGDTVVADGTGGSGVPRDVCVDCHSHAEHDFVFTEVP